VLKYVLMPTLGLDMEDATIQTWFKREGEQVIKDEPLLVVETDKAAIEINAPETGLLHQILHPVGTSVPVTHPIAVIDASESAGASDVATAPAAVPSPAPEAAKPATKRDAGSLDPRVEPQGIRASPAARRAARELGVDLSRVRGTGPAARIQGEDVHRFAGAAGQAASKSTVATPLGAAVSGVELPGRVVPWGRKRRLTAQRMAQSARAVARITLHVEVDATEAIRLRAKLLPVVEAKHPVRASYNDLLVKAVATALAEHPALNARWTEEGIYLVDPINVGVAVAVEDGLVVPVVRRADRKKLTAISVELSRLTAKAREGHLDLEEITGGTFTITNLGMLGVDSFTPILNPPETGILGVGRIAERPVGRAGQIVLRPTMILSLSVDHRVVDGAPAARFLQRIKQLLEEPYLLVFEGV
jgi:pyruvate dehydrogenase E2 component (dihydrolipoamide acetyltransferase)